MEMADQCIDTQFYRGAGSICGIWLLGAWVRLEKGKANWLHLSRMGSVLLFGG